LDPRGFTDIHWTPTLLTLSLPLSTNFGKPNPQDAAFRAPKPLKMARRAFVVGRRQARQALGVDTAEARFGVKGGPLAALLLCGEPRPALLETARRLLPKSNHALGLVQKGEKFFAPVKSFS
jgi:hypothetical protein